MAQSQPRTMQKTIKTSLMVLLVAAASIGGTLFYSSRSGLFAAHAVEAPAKQPPAPIPGPIYVPLDPFTVTLQGNGDRRILYTAITLRVTTEESSKLLTSYMPEVRNRVLLTLSEQNPETVQTPEGRTALAKALIKTLEAPYVPQPSGPKISNVLFTAFVVQ